MPMPLELRDLILRFNQLGAALPRSDDGKPVLPDDPAALAYAKLLLAEMSRVKSQIDAFLDRHDCRHRN